MPDFTCPSCHLEDKHAAGCKLAAGVYNQHIAEIKAIVTAYLVEYHEDLGDLDDYEISEFAGRYAIEHPRE